MISMIKSEWFPLFNVLPVGRLSNDQDDEIGMVPPLAYFASGGEPPHSYFAFARAQWRLQLIREQRFTSCYFLRIPQEAAVTNASGDLHPAATKPCPSERSHCIE